MAMAEYRDSQLLLSTTLLFILTSNISVVGGQTTGVFLSLNGVTIPNDGYVVVSDIGLGDSGLHCNTDRSDCCRASDHPSGVPQGQWYYPVGSQVLTYAAENSANPSGNFFSRDRSTGVVRLNRNGDPTDRGRFRCEIPNASGITVTLYVNIVDMLPTTATLPRPTEPATTTTQADILNTTVTQSNNIIPPTTTSPDTPGTTVLPPVSVDIASITTIGTNTAGEVYSLVCSVSVTGSIDQPTITWQNPMNNEIMSTTGSMSTLTLNLLTASDAGTYTCRATLGNAMDSASWTVTVQDPTITVRIIPSVNTPMVGSTYNLTCVVIGAERLTNRGAMVTYQWFKNGVVVPNQTVVTTSFNSLTFSDNGAYTCQVTVTSSLLSASITTSMANPVSIRLTLPTPTVTLMSGLTGSIVAVGSTVTLICIVQMHSLVRVSDLTILTVDTRLSMLGGESRALTGLTVTATTLTYTTQLNSFGRNDSGSYSCTATVRPQPEVSSYLTPSSPVTSLFLQVISNDIGVYMSLHGRLYVTNNSYIDIDIIGEGDDGALLCITDLTQCCRVKDTPSEVGALGEWFYPTGTAVDTKNSGDDIYRNRGLSVVRLNRRNNALSPTGLYCCVIPDSTNSLRRICTNIVLEVPTTPGPASPTTGASCPLPGGEQLPSAPCTCIMSCSSEVGIAVGALLLVERIIAGVIAIIVVSCWFATRRRKSGKSDFAVSANMAYGQVKLDTLGDVGGEYEDPDRLARSGQSGGGNYEPTGHPAPYELPVSKPEAPVYATADDTTTSGKTPK